MDGRATGTLRGARIILWFQFALVTVVFVGSVLPLLSAAVGTGDLAGLADPGAAADAVRRPAADVAAGLSPGSRIACRAQALVCALKKSHIASVAATGASGWDMTPCFAPGQACPIAAMS